MIIVNSYSKIAFPPLIPPSALLRILLCHFHGLRARHRLMTTRSKIGFWNARVRKLHFANIATSTLTQHKHDKEEDVQLQEHLRYEMQFRNERM